MTRASKPTPRPEASPTRALARGLRVLEAVAFRSDATLVEIADACDLSPSTTLRILDTLRAREFVVRSETRTYSVGVRAFEIGASFRSDTRLRETGSLILQRLVEATGQTALVAVLDGPSVVVIDLREGTGALRSALRIGARYPAHATATGKALLASLWGARLTGILGDGPYEALTPHTVTERAALIRALAEVRTASVAVEREEHSPHIWGFACAIRNVSGEVIAAIGIQGPASVLMRHEGPWARLLAEASRDLSQRLGWREEAAAPRDSVESPLVD